MTYDEWYSMILVRVLATPFGLPYPAREAVYKARAERLTRFIDSAHDLFAQRAAAADVSAFDDHLVESITNSETQH